MKKLIRGNAWVFGDHVDTDAITPGKYENLPFAQLCGHCLEPLNASFARDAAKSDIIVAGENFGCGSAREIAPLALKELGVGAVVAKSFARTFYRNAVAIGLPLLISREALQMCRHKDILSIDIARAGIRNITAGSSIPAEAVPEGLYRILSSGGLFAALKKGVVSKPVQSRRSKGKP